MKKTPTNTGQTPALVEVSSTCYLYRRSLETQLGYLNGEVSHFRVDVNTIEAVMMSFHKWATKGESYDLMADLVVLKQNLCITNPSEVFDKTSSTLNELVEIQKALISAIGNYKQEGNHDDMTVRSLIDLLRDLMLTIEQTKALYRKQSFN